MAISEPCSRFSANRFKTLELFAVKGFGQVGMRELASSLGLSAGALYHHYPSKQHLLFDLIEEFYEELVAALAHIKTRGSSRRSVQRALINVHLDLHREMPWHFRLVERDLGFLSAEQQSWVQRMREQYERSLLTLLGAQTAPCDPTAKAAVGVVSSILSSAPTWLSRYGLTCEERDEILDNLLSAALSPFNRQGW